MGAAMKTLIGSAIVAIALACGAPVLASPAPHPVMARTTDAMSATDLGARRHVSRHPRHHRAARRAVRPRYYARPTYYQPHGIAPFFPYGLGYGLEPSW